MLVGTALRSWGLGAQSPVLELAVSEIVTNAMVHGKGEIEVHLTASGPEVRLEVVDEGTDSATPVRREPAPGVIGGWGLNVLDQLSDDWGVDAGPTRTRVWMVRRATGTGGDHVADIRDG